LSWYDVLLELSRDETAGMRALELESKLLLPQYGLSRLLDRIEKAGYIERQVCKADRRGKVLYITQSGEDIRQRMWPVYQKAILDILGKKLSKKEAEQFVLTLSKLRV
jgi:DNA-binding MarR family transcriptional regulator